MKNHLIALLAAAVCSGLRMPLAGFSAFVEARVHWVSTGDEFLTGSATYIPLVFGITF